MAQFKLYYNSDAGMPTLNGQSGSLLSVLNFCLVRGSGWVKPFADTLNVGCFQLPTGSGCGLVVNDSASITAKEARMSGFDSLTAYNTGSGPFPTAAQGVGSVAMVVARKSNTADVTARNFVIAADSRSMYMFVLTGDSTSPSTYLAFAFGDIYSIKTASLDTNACMIIGRSVENSATITNDGLDKLSALTAATAGNFMSRIAAGSGGSITISKHGDGVKGSTSTLLGAVPYLNGVDGGIYLSPVWVCEAATGNIRGRMRGFYQVLHAIANFTDLSTYTGAGSYTGKTFVLLKQSGTAGVYLIETSNTLETN